MRIVTSLSRLRTFRSIRGLSLVVLVDTTNPFIIGTWIPVLRYVKRFETVSTLRCLSQDSLQWVPATPETRFCYHTQGRIKLFGAPRQ